MAYFPTREDISFVTLIEIAEELTGRDQAYLMGRQYREEARFLEYLLPNGSKLIKHGDICYVSYYDETGYKRDTEWIVRRYGPYID